MRQWKTIIFIAFIYHLWKSFIVFLLYNFKKLIVKILKEKAKETNIFNVIK